MCIKRILLCFLTFLVIRLDAQVVDKNLLLGKVEYAKHADFVALPKNITTKENAYLQKAVVDSLSKMIAAAKKEGITLKVISASRNFNAQKTIWERKWNAAHEKNSKITDQDCALNILKYSSMPGTSRHHWGTDFDLNSLEPQYFQSGNGKKEYNWLVAHATSYGFYQPYDGSSKRTGYQEEKWHWSFFPLSSIYLSAYLATVKPEDINGFKGSQQAKNIQVIPNYVSGVAVAPKP
jgi:D-alanyl-D-alanine carboxypeptidase